jgi:membrane fusion protein (multidrug efflux system)
MGTDWVILDGLKAGDKVIVDNIIKLRPGSLVSPHAPGEAPGTPTAQPDSGSGKAA